MALRAFRLTVSLDVSQLAGSNDRKTVSTFIVEHFAQHNIHAVQFIGTVAKVTFAVEASKQEVISHKAININGFQCAVRGGGPRAQNVLVYNYPVEGPEDPIRRALGAYGVIEEVKFRHWTHMPTVGDGVCIVRMVRREAIPRHMTIGEVRVKIAYVGQQQVCDLCDAPGHIARNCPFGISVFDVGLRVTFRVIALSLLTTAIVIPSWMSQTPPLLKPLAVLSLLLALLLPFRLSPLMPCLALTQIPWTG